MLLFLWMLFLIFFFIFFLFFHSIVEKCLAFYLSHSKCRFIDAYLLFHRLQSYFVVMLLCSFGVYSNDLTVNSWRSMCVEVNRRQKKQDRFVIKNRNRMKRFYLKNLYLIYLLFHTWIDWLENMMREICKKEEKRCAIWRENKIQSVIYFWTGKEIFSL